MMGLLLGWLWTTCPHTNVWEAVIIGVATVTGAAKASA